MHTSVKKFTVNGTVNFPDQESVFFVDVRASNEPLLELIRAGQFPQLYGPRASGKSTRLVTACRQLAQDFFVME